MQKPMFLRWRRHRSRKSAISKIPSYINPAQNHEAQNTCWRRLPQQPQFPQCHSPSRFLKQKAYVFICPQTPESNPEAQGSGTPKNTKPKTRVGGDSHSPTPTHVTALPVFCGKKRVFSHALEFRNQSPRSQAQGPDSMGPGSRLQGARAEAPGLRAQAPSSKI